MTKRLFNRKQRSWMFANIILFNGLFDEWKVYCYNHPKIKSKYRLANLFLINKKLSWSVVPHPIENISMDSLEDYYYA